MPSVPGTFVPYVHENCICNEYTSLRNRVLGNVPGTTQTGEALLAAEARRLKQELPKTSTMTPEAFVSKYTGRRKTRYQNALDSLKKRPLHIHAESRLSSFVKAEKIDPTAKVNPDPRMIQARNSRFNLSIGVYLRPIEHELYRLTDSFMLPVLGKGLNQKQRAEYLKQKMDCFVNPVVYSIDASRFDQHVSEQQLKFEQDIYKHCNSDPYFAKLLSYQIKNRGFTQSGLKYKCRAGRMSGDMQTAVGNCLLMLAMSRAAMRYSGVSRYSLFVDGDDTLIIFDQTDEAKLKLKECFLEFGHEIKLENRATRLEHVNWCQSKPVCVDGQWQFVADWRKVISSASAGTRYWADPKARYDMGYSVGQCLLALYEGVPVFQKFCERLCSKGTINRDIYESDMMYKVRATKLASQLGQLHGRPVSTSTRLSFQEAFDMTIMEQLALEKRLEQWSIGDGLQDVGQELGPDWSWFYTRPPAAI